MENNKDNPPSTPKRERRRVKTASLTLAGDERSNDFFGAQTNVPSSVYATPSRRVRQSSVTCGGGDFFGDFPSLNETPTVKEGPGEVAKIASGANDVTDAIKPTGEKKIAPEQAPKQPADPPPRKSAGSILSSLLHKKSAPKCVK